MVCQLPTHHPPFFFAPAAKRFAYTMGTRCFRPRGGMIKFPALHRYPRVQPLEPIAAAGCVILAKPTRHEVRAAGLFTWF